MHTRVVSVSLALTLAAALCACATQDSQGSPPPPQPTAQKPQDDAVCKDRLRPVNKAIFRFNSGFDRHLLRPVASGYVRIVPGPVRRPVGRFFNNLTEPVTVLNSLLQGKPGAALQHSARFVINSTFGLGGLADLASHWHLPALNKEDLGQTLAVWGMPCGTYMVLPFLGPSTLRDGLGLLGGNRDRVPELTDLHPVRHRNALYTLMVVDLRGELLRVEQVFDSDYDRIRDLYLQSREHLIRDGVIEEDDFGDWD